MSSKQSSNPESGAKRGGGTPGSSRRKEPETPADAPIPSTNPSSCISEGDISLKRGDFRRAVDSYSMALHSRPEDKIALCSRAKAYLMLGLPAKAEEDAQTVLKLCGVRADGESDGSQPAPLAIRAMGLLGESLYAMGRFEEALVWFHRGKRGAGDSEKGEFRMGVGKAEEAIRNALGIDGKRGPAKVPNVQTSGISSAGGHNSASASASASPTSPSAPDPNILGPLAQDLLYLRALRDDPLLDGMSRVKELAQEGTEYLENRAWFWRSQRGDGNVRVGPAAKTGGGGSEKAKTGKTTVAGGQAQHEAKPHAGIETGARSSKSKKAQ